MSDRLSELKQLNESFGKLVDGCDCDVFNSIRYDVLKIQQIIDAEIERQQIERPADSAVQDAIEELRLGESAWGHGYVFAPSPRTIDLAITALRNMRRWIPVSERPEVAGSYLVYVPEHVYEGCKYSGGIYFGLFSDSHGWSIPDSFPEGTVTHWQPLPNAPESEAPHD